MTYHIWRAYNAARKVMHDAAAVLLCMIGGAVFALAFALYPESATLSLLPIGAAAMLWDAAINLTHQKARAAGYYDGFLCAVKAMEDADHVTVTINHVRQGGQDT